MFSSYNYRHHDIVARNDSTERDLQHFQKFNRDEDFMSDRQGVENSVD